MEENNKLITHHNKWYWGETWNLIYEGGIGIVQAAFSYDDDDEIEIRCLSVLPEYRERGIGKSLMLEAENIEYPKKPKIFKVWVEENNTILMDWYESLGYWCIGSDDGYNEMIKCARE